MAQDQGRLLPGAPAPNWEMPAITSVDINTGRFAPQALKNFASDAVPVDEAVELVVTLDAPLPIRAMAPVLHVGDKVLTESEPVDNEGKQVRFWSLGPDTLPTGAEIRIGWSATPPEASKRQKKTFLFKQPKK